jgi:hypothetical protein
MITGKEKGKGITNEIPSQTAKKMPIHISWPMRNCFVVVPSLGNIFPRDITSNN